MCEEEEAKGGRREMRGKEERKDEQREGEGLQGRRTGLSALSLFPFWCGSDWRNQSRAKECIYNM